MLPKPNRLPTPLVRRVIHKGRCRSVDCLRISYMTGGRSFSRFSIVVPVKIEKRASGRNRMKRLIRESLRKMLPEKVASKDCVVIVTKRLPDVQEEVDRLVHDAMVAL